jgi:hypothetical protein
VETEVHKRWGRSAAYRVWPLDISLEDGLDLHNTISSLIAGQPPDHYDPKWDESTYLAVSVVKSERAQFKAVMDFNRSREKNG